MELGAKISKDVGCRTLIVDAVANLNIINFYRKLNFKFVKKSVGVKILKDLREISSSEYKTVKMFFDLNDII